jgi:hypothetical protein
MAESRRVPVQGDGSWHLRLDDPRREGANVPGTMTWDEHLEVYAIYAGRYGNSQSAERLAERGGFSKGEAEELIGRPLRTWEPRTAALRGRNE